MEAHGGYTFCGLAALVILKNEQVLNLKSLLVSNHLSDLLIYFMLFKEQKRNQMYLNYSFIIFIEMFSDIKQSNIN